MILSKNKKTVKKIKNQRKENIIKISVEVTIILQIKVNQKSKNNSFNRLKYQNKIKINKE
jgi:hypothetical protein